MGEHFPVPSQKLSAIRVSTIGIASILSNTFSNSNITQKILATNTWKRYVALSPQQNLRNSSKAYVTFFLLLKSAIYHLACIRSCIKATVIITIMKIVDLSFMAIRNDPSGVSDGQILCAGSPSLLIRYYYYFKLSIKLEFLICPLESKSNRVNLVKLK